MEFAHSWWLIGLTAIPVCLGWWLWRRDRLPATFTYSRTSRVRSLVKGSALGFRARLMWLPGFCRLLALAAMVVALARPYMPPGEDAEDIESIDLVVALDMSGSMQTIDLPEEILEQYAARGIVPPNRFQIAKQVLKKFVLTRKHDQIGMVVFGAAPYTQFPLTFDKSTILNQLDELSLEDIDANGTAIGDALGVAWNRLKSSDACSRAVILITYGKEQKSKTQATEQAKGMAEQNPKDELGCQSEGFQGIRIYPILVGNSEHSKIYAGRDITGRPMYQRTVSDTDPVLLQDIAESTHGKFTLAADRAALENTMRTTLEQLEKTRRENLNPGQNRELFQYFLFFAFALLAFEVLTRTTWLRRFP